MSVPASRSKVSLWVTQRVVGEQRAHGTQFVRSRRPVPQPARVPPPLAALVPPRPERPGEQPGQRRRDPDVGQRHRPTGASSSSSCSARSRWRSTWISPLIAPDEAAARPRRPPFRRVQLGQAGRQLLVPDRAVVQRDEQQRRLADGDGEVGVGPSSGPMSAAVPMCQRTAASSAISRPVLVSTRAAPLRRTAPISCWARPRRMCSG